MPVGLSRYSHLCNEAGGILDDIIVSRFDQHHLVVCNAGNTPKVLSWLHRQSDDFDVHIINNTPQTAMVAIQGPDALGILGGLSPIPIDDLKRYHFKHGQFMDADVAIFRSGYTGEDGVEIILPAKMGSIAMKLLGGRLDKPDATIKPAGLGARDTLRLEAAMPLYGHELTENIDPITAGLDWAVDLSKDFVGAEVLRKIKQTAPKRKLVGLELDGKRIARQGTPVMRDGKPIGEVTSGTLAPTLHKSIAMAYVDADAALEGMKLTVDLKATHSAATVVKLPFYKRT
jgi:aminomethyltransferase